MLRCEYFKYLNIEIEIEILKTNYFKKHFDDFTKYAIQIRFHGNNNSTPFNQ